jgi:hypothetical protein
MEKRGFIRPAPGNDIRPASGKYIRGAPGFGCIALDLGFGIFVFFSDSL